MRRVSSRGPLPTRSQFDPYIGERSPLKAVLGCLGCVAILGLMLVTVVVAARLFWALIEWLW